MLAPTKSSTLKPWCYHLVGCCLNSLFNERNTCLLMCSKKTNSIRSSPLSWLHGCMWNRRLGCGHIINAHDACGLGNHIASTGHGCLAKEGTLISRFKCCLVARCQSWMSQVRTTYGFQSQFTNSRIRPFYVK